MTVANFSSIYVNSFANLTGGSAKEEEITVVVLGRDEKHRNRVGTDPALAFPGKNAILSVSGLGSFAL
jgi:hypothetical protein